MNNIIAEEHWVKKGDVDLFVYRKNIDTGEQRPVFFLVHGSSFCGKSGFDLTVSGKPNYSFMDKFVELGYDVWTMDFEGYGRSSRTNSNSNISMAIDDLDRAIELVENETGLASYYFYGQSSGAIRLALYAEKRPGRVKKAILDAFVWTGENAPTLIKRREKLDQWRSNNVRPVDREFYHSIFNRDEPGTSEEGVSDALADAELQYGDTVPTGTYLDMCANLPINDPKNIKCPVMIMRGEHDGIATEKDLLNYFEELEVSDKQFIMIPNMAHVAPLSKNRHLFWHACHAFISAPEAK
nr:alpha/beta fold hydrolase [Halomonas socia]